MRLHVNLLSAAITLFVLNGCAGYGNYMLTSEPPLPTNAKDIHVYSLVQPSLDYEVLGYISVHILGAQDSGNELRDKLKERAAQIGANAIISFKLNVDLGGGGAEGIAIRYK